MSLALRPCGMPARDGRPGAACGHFINTAEREPTVEQLLPLPEAKMQADDGAPKLRPHRQPMRHWRRLSGRTGTPHPLAGRGGMLSLAVLPGAGQ